MYLYVSGFGDTSRAKDFHDKSIIQTNDRKRAKSYPNGGPSDRHPIPLLELPKPPQPIEEEGESEVSSFTLINVLDGFHAQFSRTLSSIIEHKIL